MSASEAMEQGNAEELDQEIPADEDVSDEEINKAILPERSAPEFSSENFKIEIQNLPKYFGMGQMKKLVNKKLKLNANKLKPCGPKYMFVCFRNEEDKEKALMVLNGFVFKGNTLKAVSAKAVADPYKAKQSLPVAVDTRPVEERIQEAVCPYASLSYENQLNKKLAEIVTIVKRLGSEITKVNPSLGGLVQSCVSEHGTVAPVLEFLKSPVTRGYRNKCEFSVGYMNTEAKQQPGGTDNGAAGVVLDLEAASVVSVGFRLATYKQGSVEVISLSSLEWPEDVLPHISPQMIKVGVLFEQLVRASTILPYNSISNQGNWRNIMIRSAGEDQDQLMVVVIFDPKGLSPEVISQVRTDLVTFFTTGAGEPCKVTNLFLHLSPAKKTQGVSEPVPELLFGEPVLTEVLLNLSFSVSPQAFFQVNRRGAEVLYSCVGDLAGLKTWSTLVDVCCGTGTIGLCLASRCRKVIGVELVPEAVRDAMKNAENNGVSNCSFFAGRAEFILADVLRDIDSKDIVAVVDPPRAGLHHRALSAIRNNENIKRLVFVSCDAKAAMKNFTDLSRPASKTLKGDPFFPIKVVPVDLFPHTRQYELVILFQRVTQQEAEERLLQTNTESSQDIQTEEHQED